MWFSPELESLKKGHGNLILNRKLMILYTRNDLEISVNGRKKRVLDGLRISDCHSESPMNEFSVLLYFIYFKAMYKLASPIHSWSEE